MSTKKYERVATAKRSHYLCPFHLDYRPYELNREVSTPEIFDLFFFFLDDGFDSDVTFNGASVLDFDFERRERFRDFLLLASSSLVGVKSKDLSSWELLLYSFG